MRYTDDPVADFERYDVEMAKKLEQLPVCSECGEPIQDEEAYMVHGDYICEECMDCHKVRVEEMLA
jgi:formylmethanofuran dehydrogenase subunit E